jgi:alcohol dehydrogenase class IV
MSASAKAARAWFMPKAPLPRVEHGGAPGARPGLSRVVPLAYNLATGLLWQQGRDAMWHEFSFPTRIVYGPGCRERLSALLAEWQPTRVLVVTDAGVVRAGLDTQITNTLRDAGLAWALFERVEPNPTEENVLEATDAYRDAGCDCLIGLGGGSVLDVAKAVRLRATHDLPLEEYDELAEGWRKTHPAVPPMVGIPTTAGTGSEVGRSAVITLRSTQRKTVLFSPYLMPNIALLDPDLTVGLPPDLTAWTGMDALTHCIESYLSTNFHPLCDAVALHGVRISAEHLPRAVEDGTDVASRGMMLLAAAMGATAFQKGLGVAHSLAHPLSTVLGIHHGLANAVVLPTVMRWNNDAARERLADVAGAMGRPGRGAWDAVEAVEELSRRVAIPRRLRDCGVRPEHVESLVEKAWEDGCHRTNPRPVTREDLRFLYREAL